MGDVNEIVHWLLFFFVFGGLAILFLSRPMQTNMLMTTGVNSIGGVANVMKNYVSGAPAQ